MSKVEQPEGAQPTPQQLEEELNMLHNLGIAFKEAGGVAKYEQEAHEALEKKDYEKVKDALDNLRDEEMDYIKSLPLSDNGKRLLGKRAAVMDREMRSARYNSTGGLGRGSNKNSVLDTEILATAEALAISGDLVRARKVYKDYTSETKIR